MVALEREMRRLQEKLAKHREIQRLQLELQQASASTYTSEYQTEDGGSADEDYAFDDEKEESSESIPSRPVPRKKRPPHILRKYTQDKRVK